MKTQRLGELTVSAQGLGCMGMSENYGSTDWDSAITTIRRALDLGVTFIDTADSYGAGHNEVLVGRAIAGRRDEVQLATKCGLDRTMGLPSRRRGEPAYLKRSCEASLLRLGVEVIDLYYLHRPPETNAIEESIGAMSELVAEGKVRHLGISEVDSQLLRRANAVHPITAVQSEFSLWTRDPETVVLDALRELGIGLVAYAPLGRGFLTGALDPSSLQVGDGRLTLPRFVGAAARTNQAIADAVRDIAAARGVAAAQIALAWAAGRGAHLGVPVVPIPGTKRVRWLEQNAAADRIELSPAEVSTLDALAVGVVGARY